MHDETTMNPKTMSDNSVTDDTLNTAMEVVRLLDEKKAENTQLLDVRTRATFCDFFVIASGHVSRQLQAMAEHVAHYFKTRGLPHTIEGSDEWILVDGGDVVVHLFRPEARERYALEKMWSQDG